MTDSKPIVLICLLLLLVPGLYYLYHIGFIDSFLFSSLTIICVIGVATNIFKYRKLHKRDQELLTRTLDAAGDNLNVRMSRYVSQTVKLRPTLAGMCCDVITFVILFITWLLIFRKGMLDHAIEAQHGAHYTLVLCTIAAILCVLNNYLPKKYGGLGEPIGIKQVKQQTIFYHAMALVNALATLLIVIHQLMPLSTVVIILIACLLGVAFIGSIIWNWRIKKVKYSLEDYNRLLDDESTNQ